MKLTWYGHAAFLVEWAGLRIILDPYRSPESGGYEPIAEPADVVVVSHDNDTYHSHLGQIVPPFQVVRALELPPGGVEIGSITIGAIPVYESPEKRPGDEVSIVTLAAGGRKLVFLGDLGHPLDAAEVEPLRGADVVLVPAGGPPTLALDQIPALLNAIDPRVVVPMHYGTAKINLKILPVEHFLAALPGWPVERVPGPSLDLGRAGEGPGRRVVLLEHAR